jgi:integrase
MKTQEPAKEDFKSRRGGKGKLRVWEWTGDPRITIRERINGSGGIGYRVTLPKSITGREVMFVQSREFEQAKAIARARASDFRHSRSTAMVLGDAEKIQAATALRTFKERGQTIPLDEAARRYSEAIEYLAPFGVGLPEAAKSLADALKFIEPTGKPLAEVLAFAVARLCPEGGNKTLAELANEMIEIKRGWLERGDLRPKSYGDFKDRAGKIASEIGSYPLSSLTKATLYDWLKGLRVAPRTMKNYRMVLAEMLRYAEQKRYIVGSPTDEFTRQDVKEIEGIGNSTRQPSILSPSEAEKLLRAAFNHPELDLGAAIVLGLFGGIRTEEAKRLAWDAVRLDEEHPFVVIGPEIAKKRRIRNVPLPAVAVAWLQRWKRGAKVTRSESVNDYQKRFERLCRLADIPWESNSMRHSFGTYHYALHGNSIETARILGHKADDSTLFAHYRALATKAQGEAYFSAYPTAGEIVVAFPAAN